MYVGQGVGLGASSSHPLSQLRREFPWINPGEILDDGAVSYSVAKRWDGGVRLFLFDRGGIMVDSQDFFYTPTPVGGMGDDGMGPVSHGLEYGGLFGAPEGIFGAMGAQPNAKATVEAHVAVGLAGGEGIFGEGLFHAMDGLGALRPIRGRPGKYLDTVTGQVRGRYSINPTQYVKPSAARAMRQSMRQRSHGAPTLRGLGADDTPTPLSVTVIQRGLHASGISPSPGSVDGGWGPNTLASIRAYVVARHPLMAITPAWRDTVAQLTSTTVGARSVVIPNLIASRLEQLSGTYQTSTTTRPRTPSGTTPSGGETTNGKPSTTNGNGKSGGGSEEEPGYEDFLPEDGFLTRPWLGAPAWVWLLAGGLLLTSGGFVIFASRKRPRQRTAAPVAVAANRHRRRRRRRRAA